MAIGLDLTPLGHGNAQGVEAQPCGVGAAAGGNQHHVGVLGRFAVVLAGCVGDLQLGCKCLHRLHGRL